MIKFERIFVLCALRNATNENYTSLLDQKYHTMYMFKSMGDCVQSLLTSNSYSSTAPNIKCSLFHQGNSLADTTMKIYKFPHQSIPGSIPVVTMIRPTTIIEHPFYT